MNRDKPLVSKVVLLEKFPGKGGWTYCRLPEIKPNRKNHFGWLRVKGTIDHFELLGYHLMPMGNGELFLPVRAEIRRQIRKKVAILSMLLCSMTMSHYLYRRILDYV